MASDDWPRTEQALTIKISKVFYGGEFSHWEWDTDGPDNNFACGGTAPTFHGAIDGAVDWETELAGGVTLGEWTKDNANERGSDE